MAASRDSTVGMMTDDKGSMYTGIIMVTCGKLLPVSLSGGLALKNLLLAWDCNTRKAAFYIATTTEMRLMYCLLV